jgi:hypothetical protein
VFPRALDSDLMAEVARRKLPCPSRAEESDATDSHNVDGRCNDEPYARGSGERRLVQSLGPDGGAPRDDGQALVSRNVNLMIRHRLSVTNAFLDSDDIEFNRSAKLNFHPGVLITARRAPARVWVAIDDPPFGISVARRICHPHGRPRQILGEGIAEQRSELREMLCVGGRNDTITTGWDIQQQPSVVANR